jgi:hypothetical protein
MGAIIRYLPVILSIVLTFFQLKSDKQKTELTKAETDKQNTNPNQNNGNGKGFEFKFTYVIILIIAIYFLARLLKNLDKSKIENDPQEHDLKARKLRQSFNPSGVEALINFDLTDTSVVFEVGATINKQNELNRVANSYHVQFSDNLTTRLDKELTVSEVTKFNQLVAQSNGGSAPTTTPKVKSKFEVFPSNAQSAVNWYKNKLNGNGGYDTEKTTLGKPIGLFVKNVTAKGLVWCEVVEENLIYENRRGIISQSQCILKVKS